MPWPTGQSQRRRLEVSITNALVGLARAGALPTGGPFRSIYHLTQRVNHLAGETFRQTTAPQHWHFALMQIVFMDIYFTEDLDRLERGLGRLLRMRGPFGHSPDELRSTFTEIRSGAGAGWKRLGGIDLTRVATAVRPTLLEEMQLWLYRISPSAVAVGIEARPSAAATQRFNELSSQPAEPERGITRFHLRHGITAMWESPETQVRMKEYDEFFLSLNAEVTRLLRRTVGTGMALRGPVPHIEVISIDRPRADLPAWQAGSDADDVLRLRTFLGLLGRSALVSPYVNDWAEYYAIERGERRGHPCYQLLVSLPDHAALKKSWAPEVSVQDTYGEVIPFLALDGFYDDVWRSVLAARNTLAPILHQEGVRGGAPGLGAIHRKMAHANYLSFRELRLWTELSERYRRALLRDVEFTRRAVGSGTEPIGLGQDLLRQVDHMHALCESQLSVLRPSFAELLNYKALRADRTLQITVAVLAGISLLAAFLGLLTEDMKRAGWSWLAHLLWGR